MSEKIHLREKLFTLAVLVVVAAAVFGARDWELKARLFPWVIGFPVLGLAALLLLLQVTGLAQPSRSLADLNLQSDLEPAVARRRGLAIVSWLLGFAAAVWLLGFPLGGPLATLAYLKGAARERWPLSLALTAGTAAVFWLMANVLYIPFPQGLLLDPFL